VLKKFRPLCTIYIEKELMIRVVYFIRLTIKEIDIFFQHEVLVPFISSDIIHASLIGAIVLVENNIRFSFKPITCLI